MSKYIITKKQVEEMYKEVIGSWRALKENDFSLVLYKNKNNKVEWAFSKGICSHGEVFFEMQGAYGIFEWVILKEIGGRRKMSKKEIIDGIQWNINQNYLKSVA